MQVLLVIERYWITPSNLLTEEQLYQTMLRLEREIISLFFVCYFLILLMIFFIVYYGIKSTFEYSQFYFLTILWLIFDVDTFNRSCFKFR